MKRLSAFAQALGFVVIGVLASRIAIAGPSGGGNPRTLTARVLAAPGGELLVILVGLGVLGAGVYFVIKGLALAVLGILIIVAAATGDSREAGGLDRAFHAIAALPFGAVLLTVVGIGFIAYGVYCGFRARLAKL